MDADIVFGCFLGDCGKGTIVDMLAREGDVYGCSRYNGGPQAAHNAVMKDGRWHCFKSFCSGAFVPGVRSHISSLALVKVPCIEEEEERLQMVGIKDAMERLTIDPDCSLIMPYHALLGRMLEAIRGDKRFGSVGMGVGEAVLEREFRGDEALTFSDLRDASTFRAKTRKYWHEYASRCRQLLKESQNSYAEEVYQSFIDFIDVDAMADMQLRFSDRYPNLAKKDSKFFAEATGKIILEGAQGALLDRRLGFVPHITRSCTLGIGAENLLKRNGVEGKVRRIGVLRGNATRHGDGPFPTQDEWLGKMIPSPHHPEEEWAGKFRSGWFDLILARYGLAINKGVDTLALTCLDQLSVLDKVKVCKSYSYTGNWNEDLNHFFELDEAGGKIVINAIKTPTNPTKEEQMRLTSHLFKCIPHEFVEFSSWEKPKVTELLPEKLLSYVDFMESTEGLNMPIGIISIGPTAEDKIYRH